MTDQPEGFSVTERHELTMNTECVCVCVRVLALSLTHAASLETDDIIFQYV